MVKVKICGITDIGDALLATEYGADALGFAFAPSPRQVTIEQAREIIDHLPPFITKVGVFVNHPLDRVREIMTLCSLDIAQLHGSENPEYCQSLFPKVIKSFRVKEEATLEYLPRYKVNAYLLDAYQADLKGGTGHSFDWAIAQKAKEYGLIVLSGGLNPDNVQKAVTMVRPYAVDVSSGVEAEPGKKDGAKLYSFIKGAKEA